MAFIAYSSSSIFPTNVTSSGDNYWVDVVFNDTSQGPQANDDSGFTTTENNAAVDSGFGAARQRHGPHWPAAVDHGRQQSEQRHRHLQPEHADRQLRADSGYTGPASFTYTITDGQSGTGSG